MYRLLNRLMEISGGDRPPAKSTNRGTPAATLRGVEGALEGQTVIISEALTDRPAGYLIFRIGRGPNNDLSFPNDTTLSVRHAALYRINGQWYCRDLDSTNGSLAGGKLLRGQAVGVSPGAEFRFGRQKLVLDYQPGSLAVAAGAAVVVTAPTLRIAPTVARKALTPPVRVPVEAALLFPAEAAGKPWRWAPPGESVSFREWIIPGGMVYVGRQMKNLQGYGTEPSLINPGLKVATRESANREGTRAYSPYGYQYWGLTYAEASPTMRRLYLDWLVGGRVHPNVLEPLLLLFFYGLERRLIEDGDESAQPGERALLRAEIERLMELYPAHLTFRRAASALLQHLDARRLIEEEGPPPDIDALLGESPPWRGLPWTLEITLARIARDRSALPADLAYAWIRRDPDAPSSPRTVVQRCPDELRRLWMLRYGAEFPKGLKIPERKAPLRLSYRPASPSLYGWTGVLAPGGLNAPSPSPLKRLRTLLDACCDELDPFSRFIGKRQELSGSPLAAALLPPELRAGMKAIRDIGEQMEVRLRHSDSGQPVVSGWPGRELLTALTGVSDWSAPFTRAESLQSAILLEGIGVGLEPDVRRSGPPLSFDEPVTLALLASTDSTGETAAERDKSLRPIVHLLAGVVWEAASGTDDVAPVASVRLALTSPLAVALAAVTGVGDTVRYALLLDYLLASPGRIRVPRQNTAVAPLNPERRAHFGRLLTDATTAAGNEVAKGRQGAPPLPPSTSMVRRLAAAFRVLGLDDAVLYDRLHHSVTTLNESSYRPASSAVIPGVGVSSEPVDSGEPVRLDADMIRRKEQETAEVSRMLHDIFTETGVENAPAVTAEAPPTVSSAADAGPIDAAHHALLKALMARDEWPADAFDAEARALGLLPGAALETINEAAWEIADEPALEGSDPIFVNNDAARRLLEPE